MLRLFIAGILFATLGYTQDTAVIQLVDEQGEHIENYAEVVSGLRKGDVVAFREYRFTLGAPLGQGGSTLVFNIADGEYSGEALRIPIKKRKIRYAESYRLAMESLKSHGLPVPEVKLHVENQFIIVEKLDIQVTLLDFLAGDNIKAKGLSAIEYQRMADEFIKFLGTVDKMSYLNDVHLENVSYVKDRGWMIDDALATSRLRGKPSILKILLNKELGVDFRHMMNSWTYLNLHPQGRRVRASNLGISVLYRARDKILNHKAQFFGFRELVQQLCGRSRSQTGVSSDETEVHDR